MATPTDPAIPAFPGVGTGSVQPTSRVPIFADGDPQQRMISISDLRSEMGEVAPGLDSISQAINFADFTDGGSTSGTLVMTDSVPVGAVLLGTKVTVEAGFGGDASATMTIGDGSDVDRYMTGTPSVFATAATGIQTGVPSGDKLITTANTPTITVTSGTDFTAVDSGDATVTVYFIRTIDV